MTRNKLLDKALGFVDAGKVTVTHHDDDVVVAQVVGNGGTYDVSVTPEGWSCSCPAGQHRRVCSHAEAVAIKVNQR